MSTRLEQSTSTTLIWMVCAWLAAVLILLTPSAQAGIGKRSEPSRGFEYDFTEWPLPLNAEVAERLNALADRYPNLAKTEVIGQSEIGRPMTIIKITNYETRSDETKPAVWLDGNIHASEITGRQYLMYFAERILYEYGKNPDVTRLMDTRAFYVLPVFDVDGGERTRGRRHRRIIPGFTF